MFYSIRKQYIIDEANPTSSQVWGDVTNQLYEWTTNTQATSVSMTDFQPQLHCQSSQSSGSMAWVFWSILLFVLYYKRVTVCPFSPLHFRMKRLTLVQQHGNGLWNMCFTKLLGLTFYLLNTLQRMATFCSLLTCLTCIKSLRGVNQVVTADWSTAEDHSLTEG